jgi:serine/threonine protein kinase
MSNSPDSRKKQVVCMFYEVEQLIGSGSFGNVYRCRHIQTGKYYAIKEFKTKFTNRKRAFEMREI